MSVRLSRADGFKRARAKMGAAHTRFNDMRLEQKAPNYTKYLIDGRQQRVPAWGANGCNPPVQPSAVRL